MDAYMGSRTIGMLALALAGTALQACSLPPGGAQAGRAAAAAVAEGAEDRRAYNDRKAAALLALPCDISVGAYYRLANAVQQEALAMLCSGRRPGEPAPALERSGAPGRHAPSE